MKLGKKTSSVGRPQVNANKKSGIIIGLVFVTILLIAWVIWLGHKAQETVTVAVYAQGLYKNQLITNPETMFEPYEMLRAEYEKLSVTYENGETKRRIMLYEEVPQLKGWYAAYPLMQGDYVQYRSFIGKKTDNSNTVLYNFPGKEIVSFDIDTGLIGTFKTFLEPGDKINVQATYKETIEENKDDGTGMNLSKEEVDVFRTERAFSGIAIADMLNDQDSSILDMYAYYNNLSAYQQSSLDNDSSWKSSTSPSKVLVALTPEELERYYYYKNKDATFEVSLPQRAE